MALIERNFTIGNRPGQYSLTEGPDNKVVLEKVSISWRSTISFYLSRLSRLFSCSGHASLERRIQNLLAQPTNLEELSLKEKGHLLHNLRQLHRFSFLSPATKERLKTLDAQLMQFIGTDLEREIAAIDRTPGFASSAKEVILAFLSMEETSPKIQRLKEKFPHIKFQHHHKFIRVSGLGRNIEFWRNSDGEWDAWVPLNKARIGDEKHGGMNILVGKAKCVYGKHIGQDGGRATGDWRKQDIRERILHEFKMFDLLKRRGDPKVRTLYDYGITYKGKNGKRKIAFMMPWAPESLEGKLTRGYFLEDKKKDKIIKNLLDEVTFLHRVGIIHRDIKPDNILLDEEENARLTDFDLSMEITAPDGKWRGTQWYMDPMIYGDPTAEILQKRASPKLDIWSLGVTLWELEMPFRNRDQLQEAIRLAVVLKDQNIINGCIETSACRPKVKALLKRMLVLEQSQRADIKELQDLWQSVPTASR